MATKLIRTHLDFGNVAKCINVPNPSAAGDVANKAYVDAAIEGLKWKTGCRVATTQEISLTSPADTIDGVTLNAGDRILVKDQTNGFENGIYVYNGTGNPLTRSDDANSASELVNAIVPVLEGDTNANSTWRQVNNISDLSTDNIVFEQFIAAVADADEETRGKVEIATQDEVNTGVLDAPYVVTPLKLKNASFLLRKYATTIGDGVSTQFTIVHGLNTMDVSVTVYMISDGREVIVDVQHLNENTIVLDFIRRPDPNSIRVVVIG